MDPGPAHLAEMAGVLADRARLLAAQAAAEPAATDPDPAAGQPDSSLDLAMVQLADELKTLAGALLRLAVQRAHIAGLSWQEIGRLLRVSPQATFERFGRPAGPAGGEPAIPVIADAAGRAITVLTDWFEGRDDAVTASFDASLAEKLPAADLAALRGQLDGTAGQYLRLGDEEPRVRQGGDYTVADVPLLFETGERTGRVTFDRAGRVSGLYVLPLATF